MHVMDVGVAATVIQHRQHLQTQLLLYPTPHLTSLSYTKVASHCHEMLKRPTKNVWSQGDVLCLGITFPKGMNCCPKRQPATTIRLHPKGRISRRLFKIHVIISGPFTSHRVLTRNAHLLAAIQDAYHLQVMHFHILCFSLFSHFSISDWPLRRKWWLRAEHPPADAADAAGSGTGVVRLLAWSWPLSASWS